MVAQCTESDIAAHGASITRASACSFAYGKDFECWRSLPQPCWQQRLMRFMSALCSVQGLFSLLYSLFLSHALQIKSKMSLALQAMRYFHTFLPTLWHSWKWKARTGADHGSHPRESTVKFHHHENWAKIDPPVLEHETTCSPATCCTRHVRFSRRTELVSVVDVFFWSTVNPPLSVFQGIANFFGLHRGCL